MNKTNNNSTEEKYLDTLLGKLQVISKSTGKLKNELDRLNLEFDSNGQKRGGAEWERLVDIIRKKEEVAVKICKKIINDNPTEEKYLDYLLGKLRAVSESEGGMREELGRLYGGPKWERIVVIISKKEKMAVKICKKIIEVANQ